MMLKEGGRVLSSEPTIWITMLILFIPWAKTCRNNWRDRTKPFLYLVFFEEQPGHVRVATLNGVHEGREATPVSAVRFVLAPGAQTQSNSWEQSPLQTWRHWLWVPQDCNLKNTSIYIFSLPYCCSFTQSCPTLCDPMDCSMPGLCPSPFPRVCPTSWPFSRWCRPTISSSVALFSFYLQSFPESGSFPMSWLFSSGGWSIGAWPETFSISDPRPETDFFIFVFGEGKR